MKPHMGKRYMRILRDEPRRMLSKDDCIEGIIVSRVIRAG